MRYLVFRKILIFSLNLTPRILKISKFLVTNLCLFVMKKLIRMKKIK